ncbi:MAG TPA: hypothetical protein PLJ23_09190 [Gemmatimonadales bacterium]|nr:hypothetical protein [Gemmatimonadales bacterium]
MKITTDLPEELYRQVKAKAALEGRAVREVTEALYRAYVESPDATSRVEAGAAWVARWTTVADSLPLLPDGPTAPEILRADRDRLDRT